MTQKEVLRKIIDLLTSELKVFDFNPLYKEQGFYRKDNFVIFFYDFLIYNRTILKSGAKGFLIEPYATIHISEIEKYHNKITTNEMYKKDWSHSTIGNSVANLFANPDGINRKKNQSLDLHVFDERHIPLVAEQLLIQFKNFSLPFFLNNNTIERADELLNKHPIEDCVYMNNDNYRIIKGIIAAKLNNNPNLDELIKIYDKQIADRDMYNAVEEMQRLKEILPTIEA